MSNIYYTLVRTVEDASCKDCRGRGKCDDSDPGDISYNEWECTTCRGTGINPNYTEQLRTIVNKALG